MITVLGVYVGYLKIRNTQLQNTLDMKEQAEKILTDEYIKRSKEAEDRNTVIEKEYVTKYKVIYNWSKGDANATAEDGIKYIDDYVY